MTPAQKKKTNTAAADAATEKERKRKHLFRASAVSEWVGEGICLAVPLCIPGQSIPPPAGETAMRTFAYDPWGTLYIGTAGRKAHLLGAMIHKETGIVHVMGTVPEADAILAIAVPAEGYHLHLLATGPQGGTVWTTPRFATGGCIQEWFVGRYEMTRTAAILPGKRIACAVASADGRSFYGLTDERKPELFRVDLPSGEVHTIYTSAEDDTSPLLQGLHLDSRGTLWGSCYPSRIWKLEPGAHAIQHVAIIPGAAGRAHHTYVSAWASDPVTGALYGGTAPDGFFFRMDTPDTAPVALGKPTRMDGIHCLTVANDGRVYGMAGMEDDIGHLFCYEPDAGSLRDLGIPVSVLTARQYGYHFRCALTGPGGEIYFGQYERVNHLWIYIPRVAQRPLPAPSPSPSA